MLNNRDYELNSSSLCSYNGQLIKRKYGVGFDDFKLNFSTAALGKKTVMEIIVKFIGIAASIFALYKIIVDLVLVKSTKRRDEYSFTKNFLEDLGKEQIHPLIVEKGFLVLSGMVLEENEIRYIISLKNPSTIIELRRDASKFIQFNESKLKYEWRGKYSGVIWQRFGGKIYLGLYSVLAFTGLAPLIMNNYKYINNTTVLIFCGSLLIAAIYNLVCQENIKRANKFMEKLNA